MNGYKPVEIRYALRIENNGSWTVFDTFNDQPAGIGNRADHRDADERCRGDYGRPQLHPSGKRQRENSLEERAEMDLIKSLSIYKESLINSLCTLNSFPDELREFAAKERRYLEGAAKTVEADIHFLSRYGRNSYQPLRRRCRMTGSFGKGLM